MLLRIAIGKKMIRSRLFRSAPQPSSHPSGLEKVYIQASKFGTWIKNVVAFPNRVADLSTTQGEMKTNLSKVQNDMKGFTKAQEVMSSKIDDMRTDQAGILRHVSFLVEDHMRSKPTALWFRDSNGIRHDVVKEHVVFTALSPQMSVAARLQILQRIATSLEMMDTMRDTYGKATLLNTALKSTSLTNAEADGLAPATPFITSDGAYVGLVGLEVKVVIKTLGALVHAIHQALIFPLYVTWVSALTFTKGRRSLGWKTPSQAFQHELPDFTRHSLAVVRCRDAPRSVRKFMRPMVCAHRGHPHEHTEVAQNTITEIVKQLKELIHSYGYDSLQIPEKTGEGEMYTMYSPEEMLSNTEAWKALWLEDSFESVFYALAHSTVKKDGKVCTLKELRVAAEKDDPDDGLHACMLTILLCISVRADVGHIHLQTEAQ